MDSKNPIEIWINIVIIVSDPIFHKVYKLDIWFLILLIELLRLPFDFYERESELISGFNLELRFLNFIILFIIEYLDMEMVTQLYFNIYFDSLGTLKFIF